MDGEELEAWENENYFALSGTKADDEKFEAAEEELLRNAHRFARFTRRLYDGIKNSRYKDPSALDEEIDYVLAEIIADLIDAGYVLEFRNLITALEPLLPEKEIQYLKKQVRE